MSNWRPIIPVPDGVNIIIPRHPLGDPSAGWEYLNPQGRLLQIICRFDHKDKDGEPTKTFLPLTYCENENGERAWRWQALPAPRPLYGLDRLAARPDVQVLVCEGEKSADAAALLFSDFVTITSPNGCKAANAADWAPLTGRHVTVWPDHDKSGTNYAADVNRLALTAGAVEVRVVAVPDDFPAKWDLGDFFSPRQGLELPEGWDAARLGSLVDAAVPVSAVSGEKKSPATGGKPRLNDEEARAEIARLAKLRRRCIHARGPGKRQEYRHQQE